MADQIVDKHGNPIREGDYVFTKIRGGSHEGKVCPKQWCISYLSLDGAVNIHITDIQVQEIVTDEQRAEERSVKHPPKVSKT